MVWDELAVDLSKIDSFSFALPYLEARDSPTRRLSILEDLQKGLHELHACYMQSTVCNSSPEMLALQGRAWRAEEAGWRACVSIDRLEFDCLHAVLCSGVEVETERVELLKAKVFNKLKNHQSVLQNTVEINFLIWVFWTRKSFQLNNGCPTMLHKTWFGDTI